MNNLSKFLVGVSLAVVMIGGSAFKMAENAKAARAAGDVYVNTADGSYTRISAAMYDPGNCQNSANQPCAFKQSSSDNTNHGSTLTPAQIDAIPSLSRL